MGQKRKAWRIVGAFVVCLLAFAATLTAVSNTREGRMERVLAEVLDEYGFDLYYTGWKDVPADGGPPGFVYRTYTAAVLDKDLLDRLATRLTKACEGCAVEYEERTQLSGTTWHITKIETGEEFDSLAMISAVVTNIDISGGGTSWDQNVVLHVGRARPEGILTKLRRLLPW